MTNTNDNPTSLYRHFDSEGALLYVGISLSWPARTKSHSRGSHWFHRVAKVEIEHHPTREDALQAEREAIIRERPLFNIVHNQRESSERRTQARAVRYYPALRDIDRSDEALRLYSKAERRKIQSAPCPLVKAIKGPDAIIGPALIYRDDIISVMVAHGRSGSPGLLTELVLGQFVPDVPDALEAACDTVITIQRADQFTIEQARERRSEIIELLSKHLRHVEAFDSDIGLAVANAAHFPSTKAQQILNQVCAEQGD